MERGLSSGLEEGATLGCKGRSTRYMWRTDERIHALLGSAAVFIISSGVKNEANTLSHVLASTTLQLYYESSIDWGKLAQQPPRIRNTTHTTFAQKRKNINFTRCILVANKLQHFYVWASFAQVFQLSFPLH
eukprot:5458811-Amphidinium_carterae.1